jgi:hypothetical protein
VAAGTPWEDRGVLAADDKTEAPEIADCEVDFGKVWPLIPDGVYEATLIAHETAFFGRSAKVYLRMRLVCPGEHHGKELYRAYPVKALVGRPAKHGRFRLSKHQLLFKTLCRLLNLKSRADRISVQGLKGRVLRITTRTVKKDYRQVEHPQFCWYSVVDSIDAVLA